MAILRLGSLVQDLAQLYVYGTTSSVVYVTVTSMTMRDGADNPSYKYANMIYLPGLLINKRLLIKGQNTKSYFMLFSTRALIFKNNSKTKV